MILGYDEQEKNSNSTGNGEKIWTREEKQNVQN